MKSRVLTVSTTRIQVAGGLSALDGQPVPTPAPQAGPGSTAYPTGALLKSATGNGTVYIGGVDVTSSNGFPLSAGEALEVDLVNEIIYAVATTTVSATLYVLRRGD